MFPLIYQIFVLMASRYPVPGTSSNISVVLRSVEINISNPYSYSEQSRQHFLSTNLLFQDKSIVLKLQKNNLGIKVIYQLPFTSQNKNQ